MADKTKRSSGAQDATATLRASMKEIFENHSGRVQIMFFLVSAIIGSWLLWDPERTVLQNLKDPQVFYATSVTFLLSEIVYFIFLVDRMKSAFLDLAGRTSNLSEKFRFELQQHAEAEQQNSALFYRAFSIFAQPDSPMHQAAQKTILQSINGIDVGPKKISVIGGDLSQAIYHKLWEQIASVQRESGERAKCSVFAIHSSSLDYWNDDTFRFAIDTQLKFAKSKGLLFRIIIHDHRKDSKTKSVDETDRQNMYRAIIGRMTDNGNNPGIRVFYLTSEELGGAHVDEVQLSRIGQGRYSLHWGRTNVGWIPDDLENDIIGKCDIVSEGPSFGADWAGNWFRLLQALDRREFDHTGDVLKAKPNASDLEAMREVLVGHTQLLESMDRMIERAERPR